MRHTAIQISRLVREVQTRDESDTKGKISEHHCLGIKGNWQPVKQDKERYDMHSL